MAAIHREEERLGPLALWQQMKRILSLVRKRRWLLWALLLLSATVAGLELALPLIVRNLIDNHLVQSQGGDPRSVLLLAGLYLLLLMLIFTLGVGVAYGLQLLGQEAVYTLRQQVWEKIQALPTRFFDQNPVGRLVSRVTNDTASLSDLFSSVLSSVVNDVVLFLGILCFLLLLDPGTALRLLLLFPPLIFLAWLFKRVSQRLYRVIRVQVAKLNTFLQEAMSGLQVIRAFVRQRDFSRKFEALNQEYFATQMRLVYAMAFFRPIVDAFATGAAAVVIWYAGGEVARGELSLGTLVAFLFYLKRLFVPLQNLTENFNILQSSVISSERLFGILDMPAESDGETQAPGDQPLAIEFSGVRFAYEPGKPVLQEVSFAVPAGQKIAVVGPSGSGKSTLISLLFGLYPLEAEHGDIRIGGLSIRRWRREALSQRIALVPQELFLFSGSVQDNITLFDPPDHRLEDTLRICRLQPLRDKLPGGLQHELRERGVSISQGERQLVSLARAVFHGGDVLVLDEATSSIDSENEARIQDALEELLRGRTALIIAHRLSTVRRADRILVLSKGRIVEQGTHAELLARNGLYAYLHATQLAAPR